MKNTRNLTRADLRLQKLALEPIPRVDGFGCRARVVIDPSYRTEVVGAWTKPELLTTNFGRILQGLLDVTNASSVGKTLVNDAGVGATIQVVNTGVNTFNTYGTRSALSSAKLYWGNGTGTPARGDSSVSGVQDSFVGSTQTPDEAAGNIVINGSKVFAGVATTLRRVGLGMKATISAANDFMLIDHATYADTAVVTSQAVGVQYTIQY